MTEFVKLSAETIHRMTTSYLLGNYDEDLYIQVLESFVERIKEEKSKKVGV